METLEKKSTTTTINDRLAEIPFPSEVIGEILSRLPVKSILRFRSVSNPWRSLISNPSFTKLQFARATALRRTALLISAYDTSTRKLYFLSAGHDGGPVTHLVTLDNIHPTKNDYTEVEHLNGLVCFTSSGAILEIQYSLILNPSTRKIFKLPDPTNHSIRKAIVSHFYFGFDESRNEHKILNIKMLHVRSTEIMIFSMSNYSWRQIDAKLPINIRYQDHHIERSLCINSIIYLLVVAPHLLSGAPHDVFVWAFDLRTEQFSTISTPRDIVPRDLTTMYYYINGNQAFKSNDPRMIKINGCIGVVCHDRVVENNEMHIWILQDYENRVWVKKTITFPVSWIELGKPFPLDSVNTDEIIFSPCKLIGNGITLPIDNIKSGCFKWVDFALDHPFLCSKTVKFEQIRCYVESIVPI